MYVTRHKKGHNVINWIDILHKTIVTPQVLYNHKKNVTPQVLYNHQKNKSELS